MLFVLLACLTGSLATAQDLPDGFSASSNGTILISGISAKLMHYDAKWQSGKFKVDPSYVTASNITGDQWTFDSQIIAHSGETLNMANTITTDKANASIHWVIDAHGQAVVPTRVLAMELSLPTSRFAGKAISIDAKEVQLPDEVGKQDIYVRDNIRRLFI
jgi:hypothetical protein